MVDGCFNQCRKGLFESFVFGGAVGGFLGAYIAKRTDQNMLRKIFSVFIILIGMAVFVENLFKLL